MLSGNCVKNSSKCHIIPYVTTLHVSISTAGDMQFGQCFVGNVVHNSHILFPLLCVIVRQVTIRSTDVDRTLMSAESQLASLFAPGPDQVRITFVSCDKPHNPSFCRNSTCH